MNSRILKHYVIGLSWLWATAFVPIETYISFTREPYPVPGLGVLSGYTVNVLGVGITMWGVISLRRAKWYALSLVTAGWAWTTAVFWRATNLRHWYAAEFGDLEFGSKELWLAPLVTVLVGSAFVGSVVLLLRSERKRT
jgi:hypothetical protein